MVDYRFSLIVWGFPFFIAFVRVAYGRVQRGFPFLIVFVRFAYGRLQTLASVGLSVFYCF